VPTLAATWWLWDRRKIVKQTKPLHPAGHRVRSASIIGSLLLVVHTWRPIPWIAPNGNIRGVGVKELEALGRTCTSANHYTGAVGILYLLNSICNLTVEYEKASVPSKPSEYPRTSKHGRAYRGATSANTNVARYSLPSVTDNLTGVTLPVENVIPNSGRTFPPVNTSQVGEIKRRTAITSRPKLRNRGTATKRKTTDERIKRFVQYHGTGREISNLGPIDAFCKRLPTKHACFGFLTRVFSVSTARRRRTVPLFYWRDDVRNELETNTLRQRSSSEFGLGIVARLGSDAITSSAERQRTWFSSSRATREIRLLKKKKKNSLSCVVRVISIVLPLVRWSNCTGYWLLNGHPPL